MKSWSRWTSDCIAATALFASANIAFAEPQQFVVQPKPPFTTTLSNNIPLAFGMDEATASAALRAPLNYLSGPPGNEIFLAVRSLGGSGAFFRDDKLYLQFRNGRLTGWKGDWARNLILR